MAKIEYEERIFVLREEELEKRVKRKQNRLIITTIKKINKKRREKK